MTRDRVGGNISGAVQTAIRLNADDCSLMRQLRLKLGLGLTDVLRLALRRLAELEGVTLDVEPTGKGNAKL